MESVQLVVISFELSDVVMHSTLHIIHCKVQFAQKSLDLSKTITVYVVLWNHVRVFENLYLFFYATYLVYVSLL